MQADRLLHLIAEWLGLVIIVCRFGTLLLMPVMVAGLLGLVALHHAMTAGHMAARHYFLDIYFPGQVCVVAAVVHASKPFARCLESCLAP